MEEAATPGDLFQFGRLGLDPSKDSLASQRILAWNFFV
jgi:hypothetical protein